MFCRHCNLQRKQLALLLIGCAMIFGACGQATPSPTKIAIATPIITVIAPRTETVLIDSSEIPLDNCNGSGSIVLETTRSRATTTTFDVTLSASFTAEAIVTAKFQISAQVGVTEGETRSFSQTIKVEVQARTQVTYRLDWYETWQSGEIIIDNQRSPYRVRTGLQPKLSSGNPQPCQIAAGPTSTATFTPSPKPPTVTNTPRIPISPTYTMTLTVSPVPPTATPIRPRLTPAIVPIITKNRDWTPELGVFSGMPMVLVPPGCFNMGSTDNGSNERPAHQVCITKPFWIGQTEVTNQQYGLDGRFRGIYYPRDSVTWEEAKAFCSTRGMRLPTEAEWEYAARGPDAFIYPWGNEFDSIKVVWHRGGGDGSMNVGTFPLGNSWVGAQDMSGNVWEWVNDWYQEEYYVTSPKADPQGPTSGSARVLRGGSWADPNSANLRASLRGNSDPSSRNYLVGFRCARDFN